MSLLPPDWYLEPKKAIVTGGRDYPFPNMSHGNMHLWNTRADQRVVTQIVIDRLHAVLTEHRVTEVIEGGARGADSIAHYVATHYGYETLTCVSANWAEGKGAGPRRNLRMLRMNPSLVIAMPGDKDTEHMCRIARDKGIPIVELIRVP